MSNFNNVNCLDLFSGLGGVAIAATTHGLSPLSVEKDPSNPNFSKLLEINRKRNYPQSQFLLQSVEEFAESCRIGSTNFHGIKILHGSPPCQSFSQAHRCMKDDRPSEGEKDIRAAIAYNQIVHATNPDYFTLEQVPGYLGSNSFRAAIAGLEEKYNIHTIPRLQLSDFGLPQSRIRLFLFAWKKELKALEVPLKEPHRGWYSTLSGLPSSLIALPREVDGLTTRGALLFKPGKKFTMESCRLSEAPYPTILKSHFTDQRGNYRSTSFKYALDGKCYLVPLRAIARAQGFPDTFSLPSLGAIAGAGIGNAFPPMFYLKFLEHNQIGGK